MSRPRQGAPVAQAARPAAPAETGQAVRHALGFPDVPDPYAPAIDGPGTKAKIEALSVELLVRDGYQGFRFRDLAEQLGVTRATIHYYYGSKQNLCEEVVVEYVRHTLARWEKNWLSDATFSQKIVGMMEANRARYLRVNPNGKSGNPWSLLGRMRLERDQIGPRAREALVSFAVTLEGFIIEAIDQAVLRGELSPEIPRADVALQLVAIADSAGAITQDEGNFDRLDKLYRSFARIVDHAYGTGRDRAHTAD
ncbi:TetR/AcrR family transcriptional regulator [Acuticoccus kandeliae]|uniref:TetR/AcrR family transcriptional regulator n=1 Tax=Acuticoccus kandeliae TaxID=2073160 RepID=UPI000D3EC6AC|nr:TetR/AcrR family transcriptional regulator [Acuticoccus kandeliae]